MIQNIFRLLLWTSEGPEFIQQSLIKIDSSMRPDNTTFTGSGDVGSSSGDSEEDFSGEIDNSMPIFYTSTFTNVFPGTNYTISIVAVRNISDVLTSESNETTASAETGGFQ